MLKSGKMGIYLSECLLVEQAYGETERWVWLVSESSKGTMQAEEYTSHGIYSFFGGFGDAFRMESVGAYKG
jgi:hypothetical protein